MANAIELFKQYVPLLDEVYRLSALTSALDGADELARQGHNAGELVIPKMTMSGLADYSRASGYVPGDITLAYETVRCNYDRGRSFTVDEMDDAETAGIAFGRLASEFIRTQVGPELDAFRIATYASLSGIGAAQPAELLSGGAVVEALRGASNAMDEAEVPVEDRVLLITPTLISLVEDLDTTKSRQVLDRFSQVIRVPQSRMYTAITLRDGTSAGQTGGGYQTTTGGAPVNFLAVHKGAVIQFEKHAAPKVIPPSQNPNADAWLFGYRIVAIADACENKRAGIYLHAAK